MAKSMLYKSFFYMANEYHRAILSTEFANETLARREIIIHNDIHDLVGVHL